MKIILNQSSARQLFPDGNALGRSFSHKDEDKINVYQVVGIVGDAKYSDLHSPAPPTAYVAMPQDSGVQGPSYSAVVRTTAAPGPLASAVRALTAQMAPSVPAPEVTSVQQTIDDSLGAERMMTMLAVFFAICALVVTAIGLYGTLAYATSRRTTEIGIRMALGARRAHVAAWSFARISGWSWAEPSSAWQPHCIATRALASFLFQTTTRDPWVIAVSIAALALTACAASLLPALRAARIQPMSAIRCE